MNWVKLSGLILLALLLTAGCTDFLPSLPFSSTPTPTPTPIEKTKYVYITPTKTPTPTPTESLEQRNYRISEEIVKKYHETHTYYGSDIFVCGDMACDIWDMLKTEGINAKIQIGRIDKDRYNLTESNHAWVLAEVSPNKWLALEPTGGYSVLYSKNPRYYGGWSFFTPKQFRNYAQLIVQYNDQVGKYETERLKYNRMIKEYNNAGFLTQIGMKDDVEAQYKLVEQRAQDLIDTAQRMKLLIESNN